MHINKNASLWVKPTKVNNNRNLIPRHLQQQRPLHDIWWPQGSIARASHYWNCSVCHPRQLKTHFIGFISNIHSHNTCCNTFATVVRLATEEPSFDTVSVWHILAKIWHRSSLEWSCSLPPEKFCPSCSLLQLLDIEIGDLQSDRIADFL